MRLCFDLDKTLCTGSPYRTAKPIDGAVELLQDLKDSGHTILIYTARGMGRSSGNIGGAVAAIGALTLAQLEDWGFIYDEIYFGKPDADLFIDDKALGFVGELDCNLMARVIKSIDIAKQGHDLLLKTDAALETAEDF